MENFIKHFRREPDGTWVCISFAEITTPMGRIQVAEGSQFKSGTIFMAFDICRLLDETQDALERGGVRPLPRL